jgi:hypothetical protein
LIKIDVETIAAIFCAKNLGQGLRFLMSSASPIKLINIDGRRRLVAKRKLV